MSKYLSIDAIMAAFSLLNTELPAVTHFSALQYMLALDNYAHEFGRDCDTGSDEDTFVSFAHKVGGLEDGELPDHIDAFTGKKPKKDKDSARIHSNFISAGAVQRSERATREDPVLYPSGAKSYLFAISKKVLLADSICYEHLDFYLSSKKVKTAFAVWVERNSAFNDESSFAEALKDALGQSYTADLINALWKDGEPSPKDIGLGDDVFSNVKPRIDWATIEERFAVNEPNSTRSELGRVNSARNSSEVFEKVAGLSRNLVFFGAPGTGKSYQLNVLAKNSFSKNNIRRVTFYPDYTYSQFVGCFKPYSEPGSKEISYEFVEGPFLKTYLEAITHPYDNYVLLIEEINRANPAAVFGDVFQLLDRDKDGRSVYPIAASREMADCIGRYFDGLKDGDSAKAAIESYYDPDLDFDGFCELSRKDLCLPPNMYIWATMNSADQGVFPMDTAFKRRWDFKYMDIDAGASAVIDGVALNEIKVPCGKQTVKWNDFRVAINNFLMSDGLRVNEDKLLGPFFVAPSSLTPGNQFVRAFKDKVLLYLFEDVSKNKHAKLFRADLKTYSQVCKAFEKEGMAIFGEEFVPPVTWPNEDADIHDNEDDAQE